MRQCTFCYLDEVPWKITLEEKNWLPVKYFNYYKKALPLLWWKKDPWNSPPIL